MWPFNGVKPPPEPLAARMDTLEDNFKRLERRFVKLRAEYTRAVRDQYEPAEEEEEYADGE